MSGFKFFQVRVFATACLGLKKYLSQRQQPLAELVGCVMHSCNQVKAWVRSNAGVLLRSGRGFNKEVYQELQAAVRPLTPSPPLNTVLILPDGYEEIMRGVFELFEEVA